MQVNISPDAAALSPVNIFIYYKKNIYTIYGLEEEKGKMKDGAEGDEGKQSLVLILATCSSH
jgi:hypothetical protein